MRRLPDEVLGAGFEFVRLEVDKGSPSRIDMMLTGAGFAHGSNAGANLSPSCWALDFQPMLSLSAGDPRVLLAHVGR